MSSSAETTDLGRVNIHPVRIFIEFCSLCLLQLAITSICDHNIRARHGGCVMPANCPVIGLLFGSQTGLDVEIMDSCEAIYRMSNEQPSLDIVAIDQKRALLTAVYPTYELLGWYAVGSNTEAWHASVHKSMMSLNESPLFLLLNGNFKNTDQVRILL